MGVPVMKKVMKSISLFLCAMIFATSLPVWSFPWKKENRELINSQEMENKIYIEIGVTL